jgi:pilus assembly protein CpaB
MVPDEVTFAALDDVVGRTPRSLILANEAIRMERLARPDAGIGLNAVVEPGKRAMTVATDTEDAVAGLLQPGNYVDIIVTIKPEEGTIQAKWATDTILQGIKVLAVGGSISQAPLDEQQARIASNKPQEPTESKTDTKTKKRASQQDVMRRMKPSITLEVTPEDAERLALAVDQGEIHVVLRSDIDILHYEDNALITSKELIGLPPGEVAPDPLPKRRDAVEVPPVPTGPTAVVIQGSNKTDVALNPDGSVQTENTQKRKKNR